MSGAGNRQGEPETSCAIKREIAQSHGHVERTQNSAKRNSMATMGKLKSPKK
jgi:hypothetical protein